MFNQNSPSVSVVIPCYNSARFIARAIRSVLDDSNPQAEVIVIDDGSTDESLTVIQSFGTAVRWKTGPNQGACRARNGGLDLASAEFVLFLDADDYIELNSVYEWARCGSQADIVFGPFAYETGRRRIAGTGPDLDGGPDSVVCQWLEGRFVPSCAVLWRSSFLRSIAGWDPATLRNQDGEVTIRALLMGARVAGADRGLGIYFHHAGDRVSTRLSRDTFASELSSLTKLWMLAKVRSESLTRASFSRAFYRLAYEAFADGFDDIGHMALCRSRELGLKGHPGRLSHRMLSSILGLKNKLRLTATVKKRHMSASGPLTRVVSPAGKLWI